MSGKATAEAPANIAFVKYWGTLDRERTLPFDPSISMTLRRCVTRTTVELREGPDEVLTVDAAGTARGAVEDFAAPVLRHVDRLRAAAGEERGFRVATRNSFPAGAGIASSASGFAALTLAALAALGRGETGRRLSELARRSGSGSAARSAFGGYVEWPAPAGPDDALGAGGAGGATQLAPAEHWDLRDVIAVVDRRPKAVSSREGHRRAPTSPYFAERRRLLPERLRRVRGAIAARDLGRLGPVLEEEAVDLHLIAMSSKPPIFYWRGATLEVLAAVRRLRREGLETWATMDAGANVHCICEPASEPRVAAELERLAPVLEVIRDGVGPGPRLLDEHLF